MDGSLLVHTFRDGAAAQLGHDLVLEVRDVALERDGDAVTLRADPGSLHVREGRGGVKPLSEGDREQIRRNIARKVLPAGPITFRGRVEGDRVSGELTIGGRARPVSGTVDRVVLRPSDWGIKPFSALMGALKVRDEVVVAYSPD